MVLRGLVLILSCGSFAYSDGWYVNGRPVPDEKWRRHDGPFKALLIITDRSDELYESWNTQPGTVPVASIESAVPGTPVEAVVFFSGCQADQTGNCRIGGIGSVTAQGGRKLASDVQVDLYLDHPAPPEPHLGISEHGMGLVVTEEHGFYVFSLRVRDLVGDRDVLLKQKVHVRKR